MPGGYALAVARSALRMLRTVRTAQRRHQAVVAAKCGVTSPVLCRMELGEREPRLGVTLALCWHLEVRPAGLLRFAESMTNPSIRPAWADPHAVLGDADLGRLVIAAGPGDMEALARSTMELLRMVRLARQCDLGDLSVWCGTTPETLGRAESGEYDPGLGLVLDLCCYLRVQPSGVLQMAETRTFGSGIHRGMWRGPEELLASLRTGDGRATSARRVGATGQA